MTNRLYSFANVAAVLLTAGLPAPGLSAQSLGSEGGGGRSFSDVEFDVAYDATNGVYCETYGTIWAAAFRGSFPTAPQRPSSGSSFGIRSSSSTREIGNVQVANCASTDQFVIVWQERVVDPNNPANNGDWDVYGAVLDAATAFPGPWAFSSPPFPISAQLGVDEVTPDVGGDITNNPGQVTIVWAEGPAAVPAAPTELKASILDLSVVPAVPGTPVTIFNALAPDLPAITKSGGSARRHFVSFRVAGGVLLVLALDASANVVGAPFPAFTGTQTGFVRSDIAGNGTEFSIVAEVRESGTTNDRDVLSSHGVWLSNAILIVDNGTISNLPGVDENDPVIARMDSKYTTALTVPNGGTPTTGSSNPLINVPGSDVVIQNLQLDSAAPCGNPLVLAQGDTQINYSPAIASRLSGGETGTDEGLFVRRRQNSDSSSSTPGNGTPRVTFIQTFRGGRVSTLPNTGLCASGATAGTRGPAAVGNQDFTLTLTGADPQAFSAALLVGDGSTPPLSICGGACGDIIVPLAVAGVPLIQGGSEFRLALPCYNPLNGVQVYAQWITVGPPAPGTCAIASGVRLSGALSITIDN
ncbi:MAG: hypothetical protein IPM29_03075 [Planctomycetes bacterium]|nr:hypothetical protein [Planctomycetota bacterium]